ncbi:MAG: hypothetical protein CVV47_02625 [Spirochaetae bacterium HGW-Spirochaetae-3]|nr:MAG: hypothetical protein CVV47_02625 [Spirochaetae bacterium HGW-Spirochaetae-3]
MRQFVLPATWEGGPTCEIRGREARRLGVVLRLVPGDSFPAIGPDGSLYDCSIKTMSRDSIDLSVTKADAVNGSDYKPDVRAGHATRGIPAGEASTGTTLPRTTLPRTTLAIGLLKGSKMDDVARAATEAGVSSILPLITSRSVPMEHAAGRIERLRRVVSEALGQSGSSTPTRLAEPMTIRDLCAGLPPEPGRRLGLFFHEAPLAQSSIHRYCTIVPDEIVACVGPEGGFDDDEVRALTEGGFMPGWLGPTVLRAETAAVFAIASIRIVCLERSSWSMTAYEE